MESYSSAAAGALGLEEARGLKAPQASFHGSLHSVRKPLSKPWKKPIAPFPPTPPKVYTVDPINFRDLVQKLTGSPQFMSRSHIPTSTTQFEVPPPPPPHQRLQRVAPPPLHVVAASPLSRAEVSSPLNMFSGLDHSTSQNQNYSNCSNSFGLDLSPSSYNWCAFPILSPGTLTTLEQSTVL